MNKKLQIGLVTVGALFISYTIIAKTGILKTYKNSSSANEPNLKINSAMLISNIATAENGDFVSYNFEDKAFGKEIRLHRLFGQENDTIEIRNGIMYVNNKNVDEGIDLIHLYQTNKIDYLKIKKEDQIPDSYYVNVANENDVQALLRDFTAAKYGLTSKRIFDEKGKEDVTIQKVFKQNWNKDNFGPLVIPKGKLFLIGDNRDNSEDSRYIGLIDASDVVGVVVKH